VIEAVVLSIFFSGVLASVVLLVRKQILFNRRWDVDKYGGILVRFDRGAAHTDQLGALLDRGIRRIVKVAARRLSDHRGLLEFRVEVVPPGEIRTPTAPNGRLLDGSEVGGSVRVEKCFPWSREIWVAVVTSIRSDEFIAHEYCAHILPARVVGKGSMWTHDRDGRYYDWAQRWLELEREAKAELERID
jgi:hypothetical protein